jgi:hypothetical protein
MSDQGCLNEFNREDVTIDLGLSFHKSIVFGLDYMGYRNERSGLQQPNVLSLYIITHISSIKCSTKALYKGLR